MRHSETLINLLTTLRVVAVKGHRRTSDLFGIVSNVGQKVVQLALVR